ncbi:MAG: DMT family transporter [Rikenellaceae bacterium]
MTESNTKYYLDLIVANILFGVNLAVYSYLFKSGIPSEILFFFQVLVACLIFAPKMLFTKDYRISWNDIKQLSINSLLIVFGGLYLTVKGTSYTTATDAAIITLLGPLITIIIQRIRLNNTQKIIVFCIALATVILILKEFKHTRTLGNLIILISVTCISLNTVLIKPLLSGHGTMKVMAWYYLIGLVLCIPMFLPLVLRFDFRAVPTDSYYSLAYAILLGTIPPSYFLYKGTEHLSPVKTALFRCLRPLVAIAITMWQGKEKISSHSIIIGMVIICGLIIFIRMLRKLLDTNQLSYKKKAKYL